MGYALWTLLRSKGNGCNKEISGTNKIVKLITFRAGNLYELSVVDLRRGDRRRRRSELELHHKYKQFNVPSGRNSMASLRVLGFNIFP